MNCKPGDLAIMVRSGAGNEGKIVRCLRIATRSELDGFCFDPDMVTWIIDPPLPSNHGCHAPLAKDAYLRPIGNPGEDAKDESLQWLPVTSTETADA